MHAPASAPSFITLVYQSSGRVGGRGIGAIRDGGSRGVTVNREPAASDPDPTPVGHSTRPEPGTELTRRRCRCVCVRRGGRFRRLPLGASSEPGRARELSRSRRGPYWRSAGRVPGPPVRDWPRPAAPAAAKRRSQPHGPGGRAEPAKLGPGRYWPDPSRRSGPGSDSEHIHIGGDSPQLFYHDCSGTESQVKYRLRGPSPRRLWPSLPGSVPHETAGAVCSHHGR